MPNSWWTRENLIGRNYFPDERAVIGWFPYNAIGVCPTIWNEHRVSNLERKISPLKWHILPRRVSGFFNLFLASFVVLLYFVRREFSRHDFYIGYYLGARKR